MHTITYKEAYSVGIVVIQQNVKSSKLRWLRRSRLEAAADLWWQKSSAFEMSQTK